MILTTLNESKSTAKWQNILTDIMLNKFVNDPIFKSSAVRFMSSDGPEYIIPYRQAKNIFKRSLEKLEIYRVSDMVSPILYTLVKYIKYNNETKINEWDPKVFDLGIIESTAKTINRVLDGIDYSYTANQSEIDTNKMILGVSNSYNVDISEDSFKKSKLIDIDFDEGRTITIESLYGSPYSEITYITSDPTGSDLCWFSINQTLVIHTKDVLKFIKTFKLGKDNKISASKTIGVILESGGYTNYEILDTIFIKAGFECFKSGSYSKHIKGSRVNISFTSPMSPYISIQNRDMIIMNTSCGDGSRWPKILNLLTDPIKAIEHLI